MAFLASHSFLLQNVIDNATRISTQEEADQLLDLLSPLVTEQPDQPADLDGDEDFREEQVLLGRIVALFQADTPDLQYLVFFASLCV